ACQPSACDPRGTATPAAVPEALEDGPAVVVVPNDHTDRPGWNVTRIALRRDSRRPDDGEQLGDHDADTADPVDSVHGVPPLRCVDRRVRIRVRVPLRLPLNERRST